MSDYHASLVIKDAVNQTVSRQFSLVHYTTKGFLVSDWLIVALEQNQVFCIVCYRNWVWQATACSLAILQHNARTF